MKALSILPICVFLASVYSGEAFAGEQYYLNGHQTWCLYKSINWWYYARPKECQDLCGAAVQYRYQGKVGHSYDESARVLTIYLEDDFADLLSVLSHGRGRYRSATLQGSAGNILSGTSGTPTLTIEEHPLSNTYSVSFKSVDVAEYQQTIKEITSWRFVLSGKIWGLRNGKLALYRAPDNLRNCSKNKTANNDRTRFTLRIYRGDSDGVLADFVFKEPKEKENNR